MSVYLKPFTTSDVIVSPFEVNKSFTFLNKESTPSTPSIPAVSFSLLNTPNPIPDLFSGSLTPTTFLVFPQTSSTDNSISSTNIDYNTTKKTFMLSTSITENIVVDITYKIKGVPITKPFTMVAYIGETTSGSYNNSGNFNVSNAIATSSFISNLTPGPITQYDNPIIPSVTLQPNKEYVFGLTGNTPNSIASVSKLSGVTASFSKSITPAIPATIGDNKIDRYIGENLSIPFYTSGSIPTGTTNSLNKKLVYNSIKQLYYSNYLKNKNGSPVSTASFNNDGTVTGNRYTPNYYNYLSTTLLADRYFPTGSNETIGVISIPSNLYGEHIKLNSVTLSVPNYTLTDDGNGNILNGSQKVGDIIYEHGIIILTNDGIESTGIDSYGSIIYGVGVYGDSDEVFINDFMTNTNFTCSFESTTTIYESQYKCTLRQNEFNFTQNPTIVSGSSTDSTLYGFATGSYFTPYVTTVGMYNNNRELIAVAKLAQPLPISQVTDTSILVNLDL
tara:strand:+ start:169 stop:1677 length:1509 start_codon:yes stop_codon:yes gene_type:complete